MVTNEAFGTEIDRFNAGIIASKTPVPSESPAVAATQNPDLETHLEVGGQIELLAPTAATQTEGLGAIAGFIASRNLVALAILVA